MIGGYQILDLRGIDLTKGAVASNITDAYVLKQLLQLRDHIDKAYDFSKPLTNQLKPVLIRFRDKKNGEKTEGATFGELSVNGNYYTFKITARISGALVLTINVAFEEITNDYGNKEWVIDTATILLKDESKTITGDLELSGDLSVGGKAEIVGDLEADKISANSIIEKMNGYSFYEEGEATQKGFTLNGIYAGIVKNGNKLTFVYAFELTKVSESATDNFGLCDFNIPSDVGAKLYPYEYQTDVFLLDNRKVTGFKNYAETAEIQIAVQKQDLTSHVVARLVATTGMATNMELNAKYYFRWEATFLLSDNLMPQE